MRRPNYFEILERLSKNACEAVSISCRTQSSQVDQKRARERLCDLRVECDKMICNLEDTLFSDFIPPLQRDNIASLAHNFWRVISRAGEHYSSVRSSARQVASYENEEEELCIVLSEKLSENTLMLRHIRNPEKMPALAEFRAILRKASDIHNEYISRINSGALPHSCNQRASSAARLRFELSRCFDELVEVMLGNI